MNGISKGHMATLERLVAAFLVAVIPAASEAAVTYRVDHAVGSGVITGTIQTNGVTGVLTAADIVDWNLRIDVDGMSASWWRASILRPVTCVSEPRS